MSINGQGPHVVILGGGFAGLYAARSLRSAPVRLTIVDRRNYHLFQPLLYQVATAGLSAPDIAAPIRSVLARQANATVLLAEVRGIAPAAHRVELDRGSLQFDYLIVATGTSHSYFGHPEWEPYAPGLKDVEDALEIRNRILLAFENAERESGAAEQSKWLTFVIVGAGPTGVELAGAIVEIARRTLARDFRRFDPARSRIVLVDAADRVLATFPERNSRDAHETLRRRGVEIALGTPVTGIDDRGVSIGSERIEARTVLWAAGVSISPLARALGAPLDRMGRVLVERDLSVPGHPEIFVAGDMAAFEQEGAWLPGVAQPAIQEGKHAAANIVRRVRGEPTAAFHYKDLGMMATIGRSAAVAVIFGRFYSGFIAWAIWAFIHVLWLIGFRNRIIVMIQWAWAYFAYARGARVIVDLSAWPARPERERSGSRPGEASPGPAESGAPPGPARPPRP